ncbi:MAG TPA: hypothetical protein VD927_18850 [Chryseosolibacter sp.]|nr:hypothetical protein [Chryseosolibacter sp.]
MKTAYNQNWLKNLSVLKEANDWAKQSIISRDQLDAIRAAYVSGFYHPNFIIRILLIIATFTALSGVTGLLVLFVVEIDESMLSFLALIYGVVSFAVLEKIVIRNMRHYKSGVTEALLYHSIAFTVGGFAGVFDFDEYLFTLAVMIVCAFAAFRYLDLISSTVSILSFAYLLFAILNDSGEIVQKFIPLVFIAVFTGVYFLTRRIKQNPETEIWRHPLLILEVLSLIFIYAAGNYFVVREMSTEMLNLYLEEGQDIPLAIVFYLLTVIIPIVYLYYAITRRDIVMLRVSLAVLAFSAFTFKYYFSLGHPEYTLTAAGIILLGICLYLFRLLKTPKNGYTHENILKEKWAATNPEAFIISQTMGGNQVVPDAGTGEGGSFGGGGATGKY